MLLTDHAEYAAPTRQHELDHADHTDQGSIYLSICSEISILSKVGIDNMPGVTLSIPFLA